MLKKLLILFTLLYIYNISNSQVYKESKYDFISENKNRLILPFETVNNLIIIKASINNSAEFNFILDSGVRTTLITSLEPQETLQLNKVRIIKVNGLGNSDPVEAYHSVGNSVKIGSILGVNQNLVVLLSDIFHLKSKLGMPIHGIIGYDLLKNFVIKVNYEAREITFIRPESFRYKKSMGNVLPITIFNKKPYVDVKIKNYNENIQSVRLLIDTGGSMPLWLFSDNNTNITLPEVTISANLGTGLNGIIKGKIGRIESLTIGEYTFNSPICNYPDSSSVYSVISIDKRSGSLGAEVLRRFVFYLDYPNQQFIFKKNAFFKSAFHYNMSGIEIEKPYPDFPIYMISGVRKNSTAEKAGIKFGDQIFYINGSKTTQLSLDQLHYLLQIKENKKIRLIIIRELKEIKIVFKLEKII